jgi:hypothetical protein
MLVDTNHLHSVEPGPVVDQDPSSFGQDSDRLRNSLGERSRRGELSSTLA